jgi:hypothetical protein
MKQKTKKITDAEIEAFHNRLYRIWLEGPDRVTDLIENDC